MNAGTSDNWDRTDSDSPENTRAMIARFVYLERRKQLVTLEPQASIRDCVRTGEPVLCTATRLVAGQPESFKLSLHPTANGGLSIAAADWPAGRRPWSVIVFKTIRALPIAAVEQEFPARLTSLRPSEPFVARGDRHANSLADTSLGAASGDSGDEVDEDDHDIPPDLDEESCSLQFRWNQQAKPDAKNLNVILTSVLNPKQVFVVAELCENDSSSPVLRKAIRLKKSKKDGRWRGQTDFPQPVETFACRPVVRVSLISPADYCLLDNDASRGPSDVTRLLAEEQFDAVRLWKNGDRFELAALPQSCFDSDVTICLSDVPCEEDLSEQPAPFYHQSSEEDLVTTINSQMFKFRELWATDRSAANRAFWNAVVKVSNKLDMYLYRRTRDPHVTECLLSDVIDAVYRSFPKSTGTKRLPDGTVKKIVENPLGYFCRAAKSRFVTWKTREHRALQMPDGIEPAIDRGTSRRTVAIQDLIALKDGLQGHLTPDEIKYFDAVLALTETELVADRESPRDLKIPASSVDGSRLTDAKLAAMVGINVHEARTLRENLHRKMRVHAACQLLGSHLSLEDIQFIRCQEFEMRQQRGLGQRQRNEFLCRQLQIDTQKLEELQSTVGPKLDFAMAICGLQEAGHCTEHDGDALKARYLDRKSDTEICSRFVIKDACLTKLAGKLHGAILVKRDHRQDGPLFKDGRDFVQAVCIEGRAAARVSAELRRHVRHIWQSTQTLVPPADAPWIWDDLDLSADEHRERA